MPDPSFALVEEYGVIGTNWGKAKGRVQQTRMYKVSAEDRQSMPPAVSSRHTGIATVLNPGGQTYFPEVFSFLGICDITLSCLSSFKRHMSKEFKICIFQLGPLFKLPCVCKCPFNMSFSAVFQRQFNLNLFKTGLMPSFPLPSLPIPCPLPLLPIPGAAPNSTWPFRPGLAISLDTYHLLPSHHCQMQLPAGPVGFAFHHLCIPPHAHHSIVFTHFLPARGLHTLIPQPQSFPPLLLPVPGWLSCLKPVLTRSIPSCSQSTFPFNTYPENLNLCLPHYTVCSLRQGVYDFFTVLKPWPRALATVSRHSLNKNAGWILHMHLDFSCRPSSVT